MFDPKCKKGKPVFLNAEGFLCPCCWTDPIKTKAGDDRLEGTEELYKEELNINNVDSVDEILLSDEWAEFFKFKKIPKVCQHFCGSERFKDGTKKYEEF